MCAGSFVVRVMSAVLGVVARADPDHRPDGRPRLLLANHVSCLDPLALQLVTACDSVRADSRRGRCTQLLGMFTWVVYVYLRGDVNIPPCTLSACG